MSEKQKQNKYKIGQKVWYVANGYITCEPIRVVFFDQHDEILYGFTTPYYSDEKYSFRDEYTVLEDNVYPTKKALIKFIENQEE